MKGPSYLGSSRRPRNNNSAPCICRADFPAEAFPQTLSHWPWIPGRGAAPLQASLFLFSALQKCEEAEGRQASVKMRVFQLFVYSAYKQLLRILSHSSWELSGHLLQWLPDMFGFYSNKILWRFPKAKTKDQSNRKFRFWTSTLYHVRQWNYEELWWIQKFVTSHLELSDHKQEAYYGEHCNFFNCQGPFEPMLPRTLSGENGTH